MKAILSEQNFKLQLQPTNQVEQATLTSFGTAPAGQILNFTLPVQLVKNLHMEIFNSSFRDSLQHLHFLVSVN